MVDAPVESVITSVGDEDELPVEVEDVSSMVDWLVELCHGELEPCSKS